MATWVVAIPVREARISTSCARPNRDPDGLRIEGVQPFLWQTSEGDSMLHAVTVRLRKQQARGVGGSVQLHVCEVDRRCLVDWRRRARGGAKRSGSGCRMGALELRSTASGSPETCSSSCPFGPNRRWLNGSGTWSALLRDWAAVDVVRGGLGYAVHGASSSVRHRMRRAAPTER